jgi:hypothetical protein
MSIKTNWILSVVIVTAIFMTYLLGISRRDGSNATVSSNLSGGASLERTMLPEIKEGPSYAPELTVGPFDIHRKYRSMEGPWSVAKFKIGDLIASGAASLPESRIRYVENDNSPAPSMMASAAFDTGAATEEPEGLKKQTDSHRALYWFKGLKIEVLDENGKVMPTGEFVCHANLDFSPGIHNSLFPDGERWNSDRLITITQGQTKIIFPEGFAMPMASDEEFRVSFQAANRTSAKPRNLKHRATFYFIKDSDIR